MATTYALIHLRRTGDRLNIRVEVGVDSNNRPVYLRVADKGQRLGFRNLFGDVVGVEELVVHQHIRNAMASSGTAVPAALLAGTSVSQRYRDEMKASLRAYMEGVAKGKHRAKVQVHGTQNRVGVSKTLRGTMRRRMLVTGEADRPLPAGYERERRGWEDWLLGFSNLLSVRGATIAYDVGIVLIPIIFVVGIIAALLAGKLFRRV